MLSKDEIIRLLQDRQPAVVAEACGLHKQTIWRIKVGQADDPSFSTMEKLSQYFENQQIKTMEKLSQYFENQQIKK